jgi:uncharacterized protein YndB with AHSA1/START domain
VKSFATTTTINATPEAIWAILTDAPAYPTWNATVSAVDGRIAPGETVTVHAKIAAGRAFPVKVVTFDAPRRMVWSSAMPLGLFKGERVFELVPRSGGVAFSMREEYTGAMAGMITKSIPDLQPAFDEFAACLKARAENAAA